MAFYQLFKNTSLDSLIIFAFLLYTLYCLLGMQAKNPNFRIYMAAGCSLFYVLYAVTLLLGILVYTPTPTLSPMHPYWYYFLCTFFVAFLFSCLYLNGSCFVKATYILYYIAIIQLYQYICSPLYDSEPTMPKNLFMLCDLLTTALRYLLLYLFSVILKKNRIPASSVPFEASQLSILYFPLSFLIYCQVKISYPRIEAYSDFLMAIIMLPSLPIMYYLFSSLVDFYDQKRKLSQALYETKIQMTRYRYSIEVEERIKKERHELKNNYLYIQSLLRLKQYSQLEAYLSNYLEEQMEAISSISTGNLMIDYLLNRKSAEARKKGIKVYTEILVPEHLSVNEEIFSTVFLNLIDNAIEASQKEINPDIQISLKIIHNYLSCSISNKINPKRILANPHFETTKDSPGNHGFGRRIVKDALKNSNGIFQDAIAGNYYTVKFMIPLLSSADPHN